MFGIDWLSALIKVSFNVIFSMVTAVPAYFSWNAIAPVYLSFIPEIYLNLPYWHIVAFFLVCTYLGEQIKKLVPKIISISQSNSN